MHSISRTDKPQRHQVFDFSCTALRTAAHHLFYDARERGNYILMVKTYFEALSLRSPRRIQVLGQICIDMHANRLPFIPLINAQAQHIYQSILADVNKTRKKHPIADMDWLGILIKLLEEPLTQCSAGLVPRLSAQVLDLFAFASGAADKEAVKVRDGSAEAVLFEARTWGAQGAQVDEMVLGIEQVYQDLLMDQEWFALRVTFHPLLTPTSSLIYIVPSVRHAVFQGSRGCFRNQEEPRESRVGTPGTRSAPLFCAMLVMRWQVLISRRMRPGPSPSLTPRCDLRWAIKRDREVGPRRTSAQ